MPKKEKPTGIKDKLAELKQAKERQKQAKADLKAKPLPKNPTTKDLAERIIKIEEFLGIGE